MCVEWTWDRMGRTQSSYLRLMLQAVASSILRNYFLFGEAVALIHLPVLPVAILQPGAELPKGLAMLCEQYSFFFSWTKHIKLKYSYRLFCPTNPKTNWSEKLFMHVWYSEIIPVLYWHWISSISNAFILTQLSCGVHPPRSPLSLIYKRLILVLSRDRNWRLIIAWCMFTAVEAWKGGRMVSLDPAPPVSAIGNTQ